MHEAKSSSEGQETPLHNSGRVSVAAANHLSMVDVSGGKVEKVGEHERRAAETLIKCQEGSLRPPSTPGTAKGGL